MKGRPLGAIPIAEVMAKRVVSCRASDDPGGRRGHAPGAGAPAAGHRCVRAPGRSPVAGGHRPRHGAAAVPPRRSAPVEVGETISAAPAHTDSVTPIASREAMGAAEQGRVGARSTLRLLDDDLHPAVLLPARLGVVRRDRHRGAEARGRDPATPRHRPGSARCATASARRFDRSRLCASEPVLSAWPSIRTIALGSVFSASARRWISLIAPGLSSERSTSNSTSVSSVITARAGSASPGDRRSPRAATRRSARPSRRAASAIRFLGPRIEHDRVAALAQRLDRGPRRSTRSAVARAMSTRRFARYA